MDLRSYRQATINATRWLLSQQQRDGSFKPAELGLATCHKVPYALAVMGEEERAGRLCAWIVDQLMDDDGDFTKLYPRCGLLERYYHYPNAWLVAGAQKLGIFALSWPAAGFLQMLQHPQTGGFLTHGPGASLDDEQDLLSTAVAGLACLYAGHAEEATRAGNFLLWLLENQPQANVLAMVVREGEKIVVQAPRAEEEMFYLFYVGREGQFYAAPALAALFLTRLAEATRNADYLSAAQLYLGFAEAGGTDKYSSIRSGVVGWAAAELFAATGSQNYLRIAADVAEALLNQQLENGCWLQASMSADLESDVVDGTAEHIIALKGITKALALGL
jgi:hypothetical protein